jgi:hypothetical protein
MSVLVQQQAKGVAEGAERFSCDQDNTFQFLVQLRLSNSALGVLLCVLQVSTLCVHEGLLAAGGFTGELVLASMQHTEQAPAWDRDDQPGAATLQQQQHSSDCVMDTDDQSGDLQQGQQREQGQDQQAFLIQQQVLRAANQLYPGAQLRDWQPHQQQWASLGLPQQHQQHDQHLAQQATNAWRPRQQCQQHTPGAAAAPWPSLPVGQGHAPSNMLQQQQWQKQHSSSPRQVTQQQGWQQQQRFDPHGTQAEPLMGAAGPSAARVLHCCRVTQSENGITNGIEIFDSCEWETCNQQACRLELATCSSEKVAQASLSDCGTRCAEV